MNAFETYSIIFDIIWKVEVKMKSRQINIPNNL